jgi:hypothetical protein
MNYVTVQREFSGIDSVITLAGSSGGTTLPSQSGNSGKVLGTDGSALSWVATSGTGTVTVVSSGNLSPLFTVSIANSTTAPAFTFAAVSQSKNVVYAGPSSGSSAAPTFRSLVAADVPDLSGTYQPLDSDLTSIAALKTDGVVPYRNSTADWLGIAASGTGSFLRADGSISITSGKTLTTTNTLTLSGTDGSTLSIGSGVSLSAFAGLSLVADRLPYANGTGTLALATFTAAGRALLDDADAATQRTTLGLGTIATQNASSVTITGGSISGASLSSGGFVSKTDGYCRYTYENANYVDFDFTTAVATFKGASNSTTIDGGAVSPITLELGHASDTTFSRVSAGIAAIEGNNIITANTFGTDVAAQLALAANGNDVDAIGFRALPQVTFSAATNVIASHNGKCLLHPSSDANARTLTIQANGALALEIGFAFEVINDSANDVTIAITTDTLVQAGSGTTGSITLNQYGTAFIRKIGSTRWYATVVN